MGASSNFALLKDFAEEISSDKRRELLRQATDVFLAEGRAMSPADMAALDEVVQSVASDLSTEVRAELSRKISAAPIPFTRTARKLAMDDIEIARPVLEHSRALTQNDLLDVIAHKSSDHMMAVTRRDDIGETVSSALVERGEDRVVVSLLENPTARISEATYERVAERAETSTTLQAPLVRRENVPLHLLSDIYLKVEANLRREILSRYQGVLPSELEAAFERSRNRVSKAYGALPDDFDAARREVEGMAQHGTLLPPALISLLRQGPAKRTAFIFAFARLTDINYELVDRLVVDADLDALAMLCRAAGFDRALFVTLAMLIIGKDAPMGRVKEFGEVYNGVPLGAAQRAIRFWKVRAKLSA
ncbi:MAG: DUF2336 domain-containing protein [Proteobacteria bacterium]|nr:DUF2336 domain-containing protein [Pseudomonadota bacterium]